MATYTHQIGPYNFAWMSGSVPTISQAVEVIKKPGEDGHIIRRKGMQSPTFTLQTGAHGLSQEAGRSTFEGYRGLIGESPSDGSLGWGLCKDDYNYTNNLAANYYVHVLDVQLDELKKYACIAGTTNTWWLRCTWTLILLPR